MDKTLKSLSKAEYQIVRFIASGAQGEVFEVKNIKTGHNFAYKRYFKPSATTYQKNLVKRLIDRGAPDGRFLWPLDMAVEGDIFGYIMELRPSNYYSIVDLMKRKANPSFKTLCMTAINLADSYQALHSMGLCYRDISFGNLFFNPVTGDVLICDNDNVTVNMDSEGGTSGTPRFIAPEIINGKAFASAETDLYSMAVLLFYMFMLHHPLEGKKEADIRCYDEKAMKKIFGKEPVFIWDPKDTSNRPVPGYQDNAIIFWDIYPQFIKDMFTEAFTTGLFKPGRRIVEKQWKDAFAKLLDSIAYCPGCGAENFYDGENKSHRMCWNCKSQLFFPPALKLGKKLVMLNSDTVLYRHHTMDNFDFKAAVGEMARHPKNPDRWGIQNKSPETWMLERKDKDPAAVESGKTAPLTIGAEINFGPVKGKIVALQ